MSASASPFRPSRSRPVVEALRRGQRVQRGYIGVAMQDVDEGVAAALGIDRNRGELIRSVTPGGPADRGGIQQGDVVITVAGQPVTPDQTLAYLVSQQPIGSRIPLELIRQGQRRNVTVAIAERPTEEELARLNGIDEQAPAGDRRRRQADRRAVGRPALDPAEPRPRRPDADPGARAAAADRRRNVRGLVVGSVDPNSDAGQKGIQPGDVILSINQTATATPEAAAAARRRGAARRAQHGAAAGPPRQHPAGLCRGRAGAALNRGACRSPGFAASLGRNARARLRPARGKRLMTDNPAMAAAGAAPLRELTLRAILLGGADHPRLHRRQRLSRPARSASPSRPRSRPR